MPGPEGHSGAALPPPPLLAGAPAKRRRMLAGIELALLGAAGAVAVLALTAWQVPPMLDWGRYKGVIETYAGARLGRPVSIAGHVKLTLLPQPMLVAEAVTLPDTGDGVSARVGALRLEVSLWRLMAGHVVPRTLVLDNPVARLPWPLPRAATYAPVLRPAVAQAFQASIEGGTLQIGRIVVTGLAAQIGTDADSGAFAAVGRGVLGGHHWLFNALRDAPGQDGAAPISLTLDGQPEGQGRRAPAGIQGTGGSFRGTALPDGRITGQMAVHGADLSRLGFGPAAAFTASGLLSTDGSVAEAHDLALSLAGSPGRADLALHLAPALSVEGAVQVHSIALGPWLWNAMGIPGLVAHLSLSADDARAAGGVLHQAAVQLRAGPEGVRLENGQARLPGEGALRFSGSLAGHGAFTGVASLNAPDAASALGFALPAAAAAWNGGKVAVALQGSVRADQDGLAVTSLSGFAADHAVSGALILHAQPRPAVDATLTLDRFDLPAWRDTPGPAALARPFAAFDADLHLMVHSIAAGALTLREASLDAHGGPQGLTIRRAAAEFPGGHLEFSGAADAAGTLSGGKLDIAVPDAAILPAAWRRPAALWQGPFHLALSGEGPPSGLMAQLRADLGDLRAEADARLDVTAPRMQATVTLRHPGTPRLLDALGVPDTMRWLDTGSFALLTHLDISPAHVSAQDLSVSAAALRLTGALEGDLSGGRPVITGHLDADTLALPADMLTRIWPALGSWDGDIRLSADHVLWGLRPVAETSRAVLQTAEGVTVLRDIVSAWPGGGRVTGMAVLDATQDSPAASLQASVSGVTIPALIVAAPLGVSGGHLDASADLFTHGRNAADQSKTLSGTVSGTARDVVGQGVDLPGLTAMLGTHPVRTRNLQASLHAGSTGPLTGGFSVDVSQGIAKIQDASLAGDAGTLTVYGDADVVGERWNGRIAIDPRVPAPPALALKLSGTWDNPVVEAEAPPPVPRRAKRKGK